MNSKISANHPGGNILVEKEEADRIWLSPDFRDIQEGFQWFYWNFRAQNSEPITVTFSHRNFISGRGPAISRDGGLSWQWLGTDIVTSQKIGEHGVELSFDLPAVAPGEDVRYAFCPPYVESHFQSWCQRHEKNPFLKVEELCQSRGGRSVERIQIREGAGERKILWLMARNHSCEATASYALEGLLEAALGNDELGNQLRAHWEIVALPFMDKDGVEEGDQGKLRRPHDHNRDYNKEPIYPEVAAAMRFGEENKPAIAAFLDFHCPMVHGPWDNRFYLVGSRIPKVAARQVAFMKVFESLRSGPIHQYSEGVLLFGEAWNAGSNWAAGRSSACWAGETFPEAKIAASFEVPYANADGVEVNPESARLLGRDLATTLLHHVKDFA